MSKKKKGDILEWMVFILEQSLVTTPSKIIRKHILKDQHGIDREIDIYAEVTVNNKILKYAFECKNYKSGIKLSHITAFQATIENKGIKGFFVTTSNYQSGAVAKAAALEIGLLQLRKREANTNDIKGLIFIRKKYKVTDIQILGNVEPGKSVNQDDPIENCPVCSKRMVDLVKNDVIPFLQERIDKGIEAIHPELEDIRKLSLTKGEANAKKLTALVNFDGASITHKGLKIQYDWIKLGLKWWNDVIEKEPVDKNLFNYLNNDSNDILASFSMNEFLFEDQNLIVGISTLTDGKRKISMTTSLNNNTKVIDMTPLGHIDELGIRDALRNDGNLEDH